MTHSSLDIETFNYNCNQFATGYMFLVNILNFDTLSLFIDNLESFQNDLIKFISNRSNIAEYFKIQNNKTNCEPHIRIEFLIKENKLLIFVPQITSYVASKLAGNIYSYIKLYKNNSQVSINSNITSIEFTKNINFEYLVKLLIFSSTQLNASEYYLEYTPDLLKKYQLQANKTEYFRDAINNHKLKFAYQPIICTNKNTTIYYEALLRITSYHELNFQIEEIIIAAEETGLIFLVDNIVLKMAIDKLRIYPNLRLAINISNLGIINQFFIKNIKSLINDEELGSRIIIEITETSINRNYLQIENLIKELKLFKCRFAIDDFGTGFTTVKAIYALSIDIIKIDGSYIKNLLNNKANQLFVQQIVEVAKHIGAKIVAEHVEKREIVDLLKSYGVHLMQGFYFSKPIDNLFYKSKK